MKYLIAAALGVSVISCSKDYLNTKPTNAISDKQLTVELHKDLVNGISQMMIYQQAYSGQGFCGMVTVLFNMGSLFGNDAYNSRYESGTFNSANMALCANTNSAYGNYAWWFLYEIIGHANRVLATIDDAPGPDNERALYKAQALTYRAYCYAYLAQFYAPRWKDSKNGDEPCVVLRLDASTGPMPKAKLADVYTQIYRDCDDAIELFDRSGLKVNEFYRPTKEMAYGVKARAALAREDWATAATSARAARAGRVPMSAAQFTAGFHTPNAEWIFGGFGGADENMWYYSFGTDFAYNGYRSAYIGTNTVGNRELVDKMADTDVRKSLFLHQGIFSKPLVYGKKGDPGVTYSTNGNLVDPDLVAEAKAYMKTIPAVVAGANVAATNKNDGYPLLPGIYGQLKFGVTAMPGVSNMVFMRASEMYLVEAEALCRQAAKDETAAQELLFAVNSARDAAYVKTDATGQALIDEVMLCKRMELWGEGADWFDMKRLGESISRKSYSSGEGVYSTLWAVTVGPNDPKSNNWVWVIPQGETNFNELAK